MPYVCVYVCVLLLKDKQYNICAFIYLTEKLPLTFKNPNGGKSSLDIPETVQQSPRALFIECLTISKGMFMHSISFDPYSCSLRWSGSQSQFTGKEDGSHSGEVKSTQSHMEIIGAYALQTHTHSGHFSTSLL